MSLIKNGDYVKITTLDSVPGNTDYKIKEYINLNGNKIYPFKFSDNNNYLSTLNLKLKDTVVIQGNYYDYEGSLFGGNNDESLSNNMCIINNNKKLIWYLGSGSNKYCEINAERGTHIYGFSDGRPFYDNLILECIDENYTFDKELFFRTYKSSNSSYFAIGGNKISRIIIEISDDSKIYSYYPCSDNTNIKIYEALQEEDFCWIDTTYTLSVGKSIKYGVSIDDVKSAIGSKYRDLMAMMAEDSGNTYSINGARPDNAYKIMQNGVLHDFAFALKDISIPQNANALSGQAASYKKGELIYGRRPKWNIWSNSMPYSIWNRPETDYNDLYDSSKPVYAMYNLTEHWGKDGKVKLEWFKDYCESNEDRPLVKFIYPDGSEAIQIEIHYHNGIPCYCDSLSVVPGLCEKNSSYAKSMIEEMLSAENSIYIYNNILPESSVTMKLGNIINWNTSLKDLLNADTLPINISGTIHNIPTMNQLIYGACATLTHDFLTLMDKGNGYTPTLVSVMIGYANEQTTDLQSEIPQNNRIYDLPFVALSSDSKPATKNKFKNGIDFEQLRATGNEEVRLYNEILSSVNSQGHHIYKISAVGSMNLLRRAQEIAETETPKIEDLVYLDKFIQPTALTIKGVFESKNEIDVSVISLKLRNILNLDLDSSYNIRASTKNTRVLFMNTNSVELGYDPHLYVTDERQTIPVYFFPLGFQYFNGKCTDSHYINYSDYYNGTNTQYRGLTIPFVLTLKDFTTYDKILAQQVEDPYLDLNYNYYQTVLMENWPSLSELYGGGSVNIESIKPEEKYRIYYNNNDPRSYGSTIGNSESSRYVLTDLDDINQNPRSVNNNTATYDPNNGTRLTTISNTNLRYYVRNWRYKYPKEVTLRVIADVIYSEDVLDEDDNVVDKIIKKDRVTKLVYRKESSDWSYSNAVRETLFSNKSNYLKIDTNPDYVWFINIKTTDVPHVRKYDESNNSYYIPNDVTVKFWVQEESHRSYILNYSQAWDYSSINDSWYRCIFGKSLYIFVKDLLNNEWKSDTNSFKQVISHWLYGKKVNVFTDCLSDLSLEENYLPTGGTYENPLPNTPLPDTPEWTDSITLSDNSTHRLWMSERFFAKCENYETETTNSAKYVNDVEHYLFSDLKWSKPREIKNDPDNQLIKFVIWVNFRETVEIDGLQVSPESLFLANPINYITYIENDGFYGYGDGTTVYTLVSKIYVGNDHNYIEKDQYYVNDTLCDGQLAHRVDNVMVYDYTAYYVYLNQDLTVDHVQEVYLIDDNNRPIDDMFDDDITNYQKYIHRSWDSRTHRYVTRVPKKDEQGNVIEGEFDNVTVEYKIYSYLSQTKYLFSETAVNMPDKNPREWITIDELLSSGNNSSKYRFMYTEFYEFDIFGTYSKSFNIIQIAQEHDQDLFYPIEYKDINKLNYMTQLCYASNNSDIYKYATSWYYVDYTSPLLLVGGWNTYGKFSEILAPYRVNGLNVSIRDIVQAEVTVGVSNPDPSNPDDACFDFYVYSAGQISEIMNFYYEAYTREYILNLFKSVNNK